jgi:hypothetical protein
MASNDRIAFKKIWSVIIYSSRIPLVPILEPRNGHVVQYMGASPPREEYPFIVLRGGITFVTLLLYPVNNSCQSRAVTSDHVSDYITLRFREDNQRGSTVALKLVRVYCIFHQCMSLLMQKM